MLIAEQEAKAWLQAIGVSTTRQAAPLQGAKSLVRVRQVLDCGRQCCRDADARSCLRWISPDRFRPICGPVTRRPDKKAQTAGAGLRAALRSPAGTALERSGDFTLCPERLV